MRFKSAEVCGQWSPGACTSAATRPQSSSSDSIPRAGTRLTALSDCPPCNRHPHSESHLMHPLPPPTVPAFGSDCERTGVPQNNSSPPTDVSLPSRHRLPTKDSTDRPSGEHKLHASRFRCMLTLLLFHLEIIYVQAVGTIKCRFDSCSFPRTRSR